MSDDLAPHRPYHHGDLRAALLSAAEADLAESGIEGFSLRRVAKRAGVSHAAPAHHFGDADGLLTALAAEGYRLFLETQGQAEAQAAPDPRAQLIAAGLGYVTFARARPALFRLMFSSSRPDFADAALAHWSGAAFAHLADQVSAVLGRPALATAPDRLQVAAVWSVAHGIADLLVAGRLKLLADLPDTLMQSTIEALVARAMPA